MLGKLSIKMRIMLWYASLMVVLVTVTLTAVISVSGRLVVSSEKNRLCDVVTSALNDAGIKNSEIVFNDDFSSFSNGVYISVYSSDGKMILGKQPLGFDTRLGFKADTVRESGDWYAYDIEYNIDSGHSVWIRGVTARTQTKTTMHTIVKTGAVILPLLVFFACVGGWMVTSRALRPAAKMAMAAAAIGNGDDLTKRVKLDKGSDELHTLAEACNEMLDRLEASFETEKRFAGDASNELSTPVSVIVARCEYSLQNSKSIEEANEALEAIEMQARKMSDMISQLLMLAKADTGASGMDVGTVNISELLQKACDAQRSFAGQKDIEIETQIENDIHMSGNEAMIMQMFINLVENAVNYGRMGGIVRATLRRDNGEIVCTFADNGIGIDKEDLPKIWDRFFRADKSRNIANSNSTGLGLPLVKRIAEVHGGNVEAQSEYGRGTTFTVRFPKEEG